MYVGSTRNTLRRNGKIDLRRAWRSTTNIVDPITIFIHNMSTPATRRFTCSMIILLWSYYFYCNYCYRIEPRTAPVSESVGFSDIFFCFYIHRLHLILKHVRYLCILLYGSQRTCTCTVYNVATIKTGAQRPNTSVRGVIFTYLSHLYRIHSFFVLAIQASV